ncbi:cardiolipin synthase [Ruminococcaceae bacterium OttesenSCG-928-L11]|nr:cardiolipin synthase [Ruminococcaceae bacterium OttesenSCG-928-L11]
MSKLELRQRPPYRTMLWRRAIVILLILIQLLVMGYYLYSTSQASQIMNTALLVISICVTLYIVGKQDKPAYKILWIMLILTLPIFGGCIYLLFNHQTMSRRFRKQLNAMEEWSLPLYFRGRKAPEITKEYAEFRPQIQYLEDHAGYPLFEATQTKFLNSGEAYFAQLLQELEKAERYIFVESFILSEGRMLDTVLDIMERKAAEGLDVRLMYDDIGCFLTLPRNYRKKIAARGIRCTVFNPFSPVLSTLQNNRDHRKIVSIDGKIAFTGGINLADEYINEFEKHGHWRDSAVMLTGAAAWSLTLIFLELWHVSNKDMENFDALYPWDKPCTIESDGLVQPYADSPVDDENVGEHVYIQIINNAKDYVYINTPYLIIDDNLMSALKLSAKSGVDIRIITPHVWDKRLVHITTRSYYRELIQAGIRIYEYSRGFNHSKTFVSDDRIATVGTTNLDYRSLYLHFECGVTMYRSSAVMDVKEDFLNTIPICQEITLEMCKAGALKRMMQEVLRVFSPLM